MAVPALPILQLHSTRQYTFAKHHVLPGYSSHSIPEVARNLVGVHSARLPTAYVALYARLQDFRPQDLREALFTSREVIKLRCMRKTLHVVPLSMAPVVHRATLDLRLSDGLRLYRHQGLSNELISDIRACVTDAVRGKPRGARELSALVLTQMPQLASRKGPEAGSLTAAALIRSVIKQLWEEGMLCYINAHEHWGSEMRLYAYSTEYYPNLLLQDLSAAEAQRLLVHYHIERYGPVTEDDTAWWSGLSKKIVRRSIEELRDRLACVNLEGFDDLFYMTQSDLDLYERFTPIKEDWLSLLAYEDPSLKGYFGSRYRYVQPCHYDALFNQIGEARASIVLNSEVIGIWSWDKRQRRVNWDTFQPLSGRLITMVQQQARNFEQCFNEADEQQLSLDVHQG